MGNLCLFCFWQKGFTPSCGFACRSLLGPVHVSFLWDLFKAKKASHNVGNSRFISCRIHYFAIPNYWLTFLTELKYPRSKLNNQCFSFLWKNTLYTDKDSRKNIGGGPKWGPRHRTWQAGEGSRQKRQGKPEMGKDRKDEWPPMFLRDPYSLPIKKTQSIY